MMIGKNKRMLEAFSKCEMSFEKKITYFTLKNNSSNLKKLIDFYKKGLFQFCQGSEETGVISRNKDFVKKFSEEQIIRTEKNLSLIKIKTPPEIVSIPGVFYYIFGIIAKQEIPVIDAFSSYTELNLLVRREYGKKVYELLSDAVSNAKSFLEK